MYIRQLIADGMINGGGQHDWRAMNNQLPYKRIVIGSLALYLIILFEFAGLTYFRLLYLPYSVEAYCDASLTSYPLCVTDISLQLLYEPRWRAIKFTIYVVTTLVLLWLLFKRVPGGAMTNLLLVGGLAATGLYASIDTAGVDVLMVEPVASFFTAILTGLLIQRRRQRRVTFHSTR